MNTNKPLNITGYKDKHVYQSTGGITSTVYLMDCMDFLQQVPEKYFDLAVVDPPYGINMGVGAGETRGKKKKSDLYTPKSWDIERPNVNYFNLIQTSAVNQIIWGGNYFADLLPASRCWIYWRKLMGGDYSDGELAWTSFDKVLKEYTKRSEQGSSRIHPTQKPVPLYDWIYQNYSKPGQVILDTHLGSGSNRIAAHKNNLEFVGIELDPEYFYASVKRFEQYTSQLTLF